MANIDVSIHKLCEQELVLYIKTADAFSFIGVIVR